MLAPQTGIRRVQECESSQLTDCNYNRSSLIPAPENPTLFRLDQHRDAHTIAYHIALLDSRQHNTHFTLVNSNDNKTRLSPKANCHGFRCRGRIIHSERRQLSIAGVHPFNLKSFLSRWISPWCPASSCSAWTIIPPSVRERGGSPTVLFKSSIDSGSIIAKRRVRCCVSWATTSATVGHSVTVAGLLIQLNLSNQLGILWCETRVLPKRQMFNNHQGVPRVPEYGVI